jgi:hypothetical protein
MRVSRNCGNQQPYAGPSDDIWAWSHGWTILTGGSWGIRIKTSSIATLSSTSPTWTDRGANTGFGGERLATNRLSHGTAILIPLRSLPLHYFRISGPFLKVMNLLVLQCQGLNSDCRVYSVVSKISKSSAGFRTQDMQWNYNASNFLIFTTLGATFVNWKFGFFFLALRKA